MNDQKRDHWKWIAVGCLCTIAFAIFLPVAVISSFYFEEDWRGAEAWEKTKADIEAQGESVDPKKYIAVPIPDSENFGALPVFALSADPKNPGFQEAAALNEALNPVASRLPASKDEETSDPDKLAYLFKWSSGEWPDLASVQSRLMSVCRKIKPEASIPDSASPTDLLDILCPALSNFRSENSQRPDCLFPLKLDVENPTHISFAPITTFIKMGKVLVYEERLALYEKNPQLALDDMAVGWKVESGLQKQPLLVSALVAHAISEMQLTVLQQGLYDHNWSDAQLTTIDERLGQLNILASGRLAIAGDVVVFGLPTQSYFEKHRWVSAAQLYMLRGEFSDSSTPNYWDRIKFWFKPKGWFDMDNAMDARFCLLGTVKLIDPIAMRVDPDREQQLLDSYKNATSHVFSDKPFLDSGSMLTSSVKTFAYCQAHVDEGRIACRLERYRLLHGQHPDSLQALTPDFGRELPHDIMNGDPYHYKLQSDGTYLLYSVGWNQNDDGGNAKIPSGQSPKDAADWVWKNHLD